MCDHLTLLAMETVRGYKGKPDKLFGYLRHIISREVERLFEVPIPRNFRNGFQEVELGVLLVGWDGQLNSFRVCGWGKNSDYKCVDPPLPRRDFLPIGSIGKPFAPEYRDALCGMVNGGMNPVTAMTFVIKQISRCGRDIGGKISTCVLESPLLEVLRNAQK